MVGTQSGSDGAGATGRYSANPVRYFDGTLQLTNDDLGSDGFGVPWGQTRSWSNSTGYAPLDLVTNQPRGFNGSGMVDSQLPYVLANNNFNTAIIVTSGTAVVVVSFDLTTLPRLRLTEPVRPVIGERMVV